VNAVQVDDLVRVSEDLGYRASDLLQANYTLWLEGPADRLYWRRWLELVDPSLQEGVHYTTMTYGGSLLANLSLKGGFLLIDERPVSLTREDKRKSDLIDLLKLGRNCTIIADSDKRKASDELRPLLQALRDEAENSTAEVVVIEEVRTVENLLPPKVLESAVRSVHRAAGDFVAPITRFDDPFENFKGGTPDKVKVAKAAIPLLSSIEQIEIKLHYDALNSVAKRIRDANGVITASA
jgi:hypothetical protein